MPVQAVNKRLDGWLVQVADVRGRLAWLLAVNEGLWVDETEGVDYDLALDGLDGVDDDGDGTRGELLEGLLRVDIDGGEPTAETWMGMVPAYYSLWSMTPVRFGHAGGCAWG